MAKELKDSSMEIFTKASFKTINRMDMESIIGKIKVISKEIFPMVLDRVRVSGKKVQETVISMKVSIKMIKSGAMGSLHGQTEIFLKETTRQT